MTMDRKEDVDRLIEGFEVLKHPILVIQARDDVPITV